MSAHTVPVRTDHPETRNALSPSAAKLYERQSALFGARMRGPRLILPAEPFWAHSFLRSFIEKLFQRSTLHNFFNEFYTARRPLSRNVLFGFI